LRKILFLCSLVLILLLNSTHVGAFDWKANLKSIKSSVSSKSFIPKSYSPKSYGQTFNPVKKKSISFFGIKKNGKDFSKNRGCIETDEGIMILDRQNFILSIPTEDEENTEREITSIDVLFALIDGRINYDGFQNSYTITNLSERNTYIPSYSIFENESDYSAEVTFSIEELSGTPYYNVSINQSPTKDIIMSCF